MLTAVIAFSVSGSAPGGAGTPSGDSGAQRTAARVAGAETCKSARTGLAWYRGRYLDWRKQQGFRALTISVKPRSCKQARYLANVARTRALAARRAYERWAAIHVLHDPEVRSGNRAWHRAVQEAQRAYPGTRDWLLSCSASEGGWGRWVPNSDGAPPGGWMQMYESTFWRMWATAKVDVARRGFKVPRSAHSWYSPLGQALASAWGLTNGRRHEWNSSGC